MEAHLSARGGDPDDDDEWDPMATARRLDL